MTCAPFRRSNATGLGSLMLDILNLHVVYGTGRLRVDAVRDLSFRVEPGGSYGLVGESGPASRPCCGRSAASRSRAAESWWTAARRRPRGDKAFYRTVQMVFQDPMRRCTLPHGRRDALRTARHPWGAECRGAHPAGPAGGGTGPLLPLATRTSSRAASASASPSHALILRPKVLLLDEPTSALDASVQAEILNLLDHLRARLGLTTILVSHDLAVVAHLCDRLLVMRNGEAVEETDTANLRAGEARATIRGRSFCASQGFVRSGKFPSRLSPARFVRKSAHRPAMASSTLIPIFDSHNDVLLRLMRRPGPTGRAFSRVRMSGISTGRACGPAGFVGRFFAIFVPSEEEPGLDVDAMMAKPRYDVPLPPEPQLTFAQKVTLRWPRF